MIWFKPNGTRVLRVPRLHYDQFGAWREKDKGKPVCAETRLEDGTSIDGLVEFRNDVMTRRKDDLILVMGHSISRVIYRFVDVPPST